jgi:hypothetical protein
MELSPEVLIYIQTVKKFLSTNQEAKNYFLGEGVDEETFFHHVSEISEKNFKTNGEVMLTREQFELLRKTLIATSIAIKEIPEEEMESIEDRIFVDSRGFGKICLN